MKRACIRELVILRNHYGESNGEEIIYKTHLLTPEFK